MEEQKSSKRIYTLDLLRIFGAITILLFHIKLEFGYVYPIFDSFISQGNCIMLLFFMLSGFVLQKSYSGTCFWEGKKLGDFYYKRLAGIYPLYLFNYLYILIVTFILYYSKSVLLANFITFPTELMMVQTAFYELNVGGNSGTWFLSCLAFCYFAFPLLSYISYKLGKKRIVFGAVIFILLITAPIIVPLCGLHGIYTNPFFRLLEFSVGILLYDIVIDLYTPPRPVW